jgi:hypothetical protein
MGEPKPLASLSSGLLARKGQAAPAMRRQSMMLASADQSSTGEHNPLEDLGWNDMGDTAEHSRVTTGLSPMPPSLLPVDTTPAPVAPQPIMPDMKFEQAETPAVVRQQEELAREVAAPAVMTLVQQPAVEAELPQPFVEPAPVVLAPAVEAPVVRVVATPAAPKAPVARAAAGSRGKAAFTLRLDSERHLQLRLVCAVSHRSAQQIVTQALDEFLAKQPTSSDIVAGRSSTN